MGSPKCDNRPRSRQPSARRKAFGVLSDQHLRQRETAKTRRRGVSIHRKLRASDNKILFPLFSTEALGPSIDTLAASCCPSSWSKYSIVRFNPIRNGIAGDYESKSFAFEISGRRCLGSSAASRCHCGITTRTASAVERRRRRTRSPRTARPFFLRYLSSVTIVAVPDPADDRHFHARSSSWPKLAGLSQQRHGPNRCVLLRPSLRGYATNSKWR